MPRQVPSPLSRVRRVPVISIRVGHSHWWGRVRERFLRALISEGVQEVSLHILVVDPPVPARVLFVFWVVYGCCCRGEETPEASEQVVV